MIEYKQKRGVHMYHIHIDGKKMPDELCSEYQHFFKFSPAGFIGSPSGYPAFTPRYHLTRKISHKTEFESVWAEIEKLTFSRSDFRGYIEGEYIHVHKKIEEKPYSPTQVPFKIRRRLLTGNIGEEFRQTEVHLSMDKDKSNPELIKNLLDAGLFGGYLPKKDHTAIIFTAQGFRKDIVVLVEMIEDFIQRSGGAIHCSMKEEIAVKYLLVGITQADLPEVVDCVEYL